jgi:hypothetical protein
MPAIWQTRAPRSAAQRISDGMRHQGEVVMPYGRGRWRAWAGEGAVIWRALQKIDRTQFSGRWYQQHFNWQARESAKLAKLHAGYTLAKFEEQLGRPSIQVPFGKTAAGNLTQNTFQPRAEYWVDAVTDARNRVVAYAVTSCNANFNPTFTYWDGRQNATVSLNETPFSSAVDIGTVKAHYSETRAPHCYFAIQSGSSVTMDRSHASGLTNLCPWKAVERTHSSATWSDWYSRALRRFRTRNYILSIPAKDLDKMGRDLMSDYAVNTYAETAPNVDFSVYPIQIGANPLLIPPAVSRMVESGP